MALGVARFYVIRIVLEGTEDIAPSLVLWKEKNYNLAKTAKLHDTFTYSAHSLHLVHWTSRVES